MAQRGRGSPGSRTNWLKRRIGLLLRVAECYGFAMPSQDAPENSPAPEEASPGADAKPEAPAGEPGKRPLRGRRTVVLQTLGGIALAVSLFCGAYYVWLRLIHTNFHAIVPGQAYRSAQPSGGDVRAWAEEYGIRSILNLRGTKHPAHAKERAAADEKGIRIYSYAVSAGRMPSAEELRGILWALENAERPVLVHCRDGADRGGMVSVLAEMAIGDQPFERARRQESIRYLRIDDRPNRIGQLLDDYAQWCKEHGLDTAGWSQFRDWALFEYHPYWYRAGIETPAELAARPGERLTIPVRVTNLARQSIPASAEDRAFLLAAFLGNCGDGEAKVEIGPRTPLGEEDLAPGQTINLEQVLTAPAEPGVYVVRFDLVDEGHTWFSEQGSTPGRCLLTVKAPPDPAAAVETPPDAPASPAEARPATAPAVAPSTAPASRPAEQPSPPE